jgi:hypothetical protein
VSRKYVTGIGWPDLKIKLHNFSSDTGFPGCNAVSGGTVEAEINKVVCDFFFLDVWK